MSNVPWMDEYVRFQCKQVRDNCERQAAEKIDALTRELAEARRRLLSAAGDDLCRLTQEEIKAMSSGEVKIPPEEEFIASCRRFHAQMANESGVMENCLTLAQLIAENEQLRETADVLNRHVLGLAEENEKLRRNK